MTVAILQLPAPTLAGSAPDQCLALIGSVCGAEVVIFETGVIEHRWGGADLPGGRLPVLRTPLLIADTRCALQYARHPLVEAGIGSLLAVPVQLTSTSLPVGTVWLGARATNAFTELTQQHLQSFGVVLAQLVTPPSDEALHRAFVETLPLPAVAVKDERLSPNAAACRLTGLGGERLRTLDDWFRELFAEEAASVRAMYQWDKENGFTERRVVGIRHVDGTERLVEWTARTLGENELWVLSDVTDRVASQERFRVLFEQSSTALMVYDDSGIIDCNPAAVSLLGYRAKSDLLHLAPWELSSQTQPDGEPSVKKNARMEDIACDLGSHRFDWALRKVDGSLVHVEETLTALTLGARRVLLAEWHDISERTKYEEALKHARDAALKHARAKADFLATMSHEIRTPMNGVIGMTRLLQDTALSGQQREYVETVRACGEGLLSLINDVLDFSKLEAGKVQLESIPFSLRELVEDALAVVSEAAQHKNLELVCFISPTVPALVRGDPTRVRQVLLNLLSNAVKFTASGSVSVRVAASQQEDGRCVVTTSVRDSGIGIASESLGRLFDAFSQEDTSTTRRFGGTGLGLAICKRLVTLMNGILDVTSSPKGSTFSMSIALGVVDAGVEARELEARKVLLVQARPLVAESIAQMLKQRGAVVRCVERPADARQLAAESELVLVDSELPGGEGARLARELKAEGARVGLLVPLAGSSGLANDVDFILPLPVRRSQLLNQAARVLGVERLLEQRTPVPRPPSFNARVLVAEDNPVNQRVVVALLAKLGCEAVVVANGALAVQSARDDRFDLILMDCQMPELDGFEATRQIRRQERMHIPIVALTAGALDGDRERCLEAGMDDYLSKPVRLEELSRALGTWFRSAAL